MGPAGKEGWKEAGAGSACPGGGSNENFKPAKVVFPPAAECRRRASAYRAEGRTAAVPSSTYSLSRQDPTRTQRRAEARFPARARAGIGR